MKIIITDFITAKDESDPTKGNIRKYSVVVEREDGAENNVVENWEVSSFVSKEIWKQSLKDLEMYK